MKKILVMLMVSVMIFGLTVIDVAAAYPDKPVQMIVAFSAGGGTDTAARTIAKYFQKYTDQSLVVVNKPGGSGEVGFTQLAMARTDGYTIGFLNTPHVVTPPIMRDTSFTLSSFVPIANIVTDPGVLVVRNDDQFADLEEFIAHSQENLVDTASGAPGGDDHLAGLNIMDETGAELNMVPFNGSSEQKSQLLGGHVDAGLMNASQVKSLVDSGELKVLAVMASKRNSYYPDTPTFQEAGYEVISGSSRGIAAPAGMDEEQIQTLADVFAKVVEDEDFLQEAENLNLIMDYMGREEYTDYLYDMHDKYSEMWANNPWN